MESPLLHPYSLLRRGFSASVSRLSIRSPRPPSYENWESPRPSTGGSDVDSATAFASVGAPLLDKSEYPYVKHNSGITLLLSGHRAGTSLPVYQSGSLMSGMVVLSKVQGVASLDIKVRDLLLPFGLLLTFPGSWKPQAQFEKSREAARVASSFSRTSCSHGPATPAYPTSSRSVASCLFSPMMGVYFPQLSIVG